MHGHLAARLDPLGSPPRGDPALDPETVNLSPELMERIPASVLRVAVPGRDVRRRAAPPARHLLRHDRLRDRAHRRPQPARVAAQGDRVGRAPPAARAPRRSRALLRRLSEVEALEGYLHKAFLGKKQFSIEGLDALVPMLDEAIELTAGNGAREVILGMAHRGRLNVLAHTVGRPYESILVEFEGEQTLSADTAAPEGGTGDVKYHYGASGTYETQRRQGRDGHAVAQPEPPRVREPGDRGPRPRRPDQPQGPRDQPGPEPRGAGADPRRRRLPRPGHRGRDAEPPGAARATPPAARSTSSPTTSSASPPTRATAAPPATRRTWRRASTCRSST